VRHHPSSVTEPARTSSYARLRAPPGTRPDRTGRLVDDLTVRQLGRITDLINAPSPAATSALAVGTELAGRAQAALRA
jgi:L-2-hydroxyglutarate oxidase